jgi:hypothetical protein
VGAAASGPAVWCSWDTRVGCCCRRKSKNKNVPTRFIILARFYSQTLALCKMSYEDWRKKKKERLKKEKCFFFRMSHRDLDNEYIYSSINGWKVYLEKDSFLGYKVKLIKKRDNRKTLLFSEE